MDTYVSMTHLGAEPELRRHLSSSLSSGTKIDLVLTSFRLVPSSVTLDLTISCPFLKAHFKKAVLDASSLFLTRESEKNLRHLEGEIAQGRVFMAFVLTTSENP